MCWQTISRNIYLLLWLFLGATSLVASVPEQSRASALTYSVPQLAVSLLKGSVAPGATQTLDIRIDKLDGRRTSLILVVTYPSGKIARSLHYAESGQGAITWTIPADAGVGEAAFRLVADGCTCGEHNTIPKQGAVDGTVAGVFVIGALP